MYICSIYFPVSSSVINAEVTMITPEDAMNATYLIIVNCTINCDSDADMCEVMTTANDQATLIGNEYDYITVILYIRTCILRIHTYVHS